LSPGGAALCSHFFECCFFLNPAVLMQLSDSLQLGARISFSPESGMALANKSIVIYVVAKHRGKPEQAEAKV